MWNSTQKSVVFYPYENSINLHHILDPPGTPGQAIRMKVIFLASSKIGEYDDISIISWILIFQKTGNFLHIFSPPWISISLMKLFWKLSSLPIDFIFEEKATIGCKITNLSQDFTKCVYTFETYFRWPLCTIMQHRLKQMVQSFKLGKKNSE